MLQSGQQLGPYRLLRSLGAGAMGAVWLGEHLESGSQHALKVIAEPWVEERSQRRFEREMELLAALEHPGIVRVHTAGVTPEGQAWYAMERIEGRSLREVARTGLTPEEVLRIGAELAGTLSFVHARGVLHRDIKPENVLLDERGAPRLIDFGLARLEGGERLTRTDHLVGSPAYMAPEQVRHDLGPMGPAADVYGLGALLYELLTGALPQPGVTAMDIYTRLHEGAPVRPPSEHRPDLPPGVDALLLRALAWRPAERFPDAATLARHLEELRAGSPPPPPPQGLRALRLLAGLSLALAVGASAWAVQRALARRAGRQAAVERAALLARSGERRAALEHVAAAVSQGQGSAPLEELAERLRHELVDELFAAGELAAARPHAEALRAPRGAAAAWTLALTGSPGRALAVADPGWSQAERARVAAWAGDLQECALSLRALPEEQGQALLLELLELRPELGVWPASPGEGDPTAGRGWQPLAAGWRALRAGDPGLAALAATRARGETGLALEGELLLARAELARGRLEAASQAAGRARDLGAGPLERGRALGVALQVDLAAGRLEGGRGALADLARRSAPGEPLVATCLRVAAGQAGAAPVPGLEAQRAACAAGARGEAGLLLARGLELAGLAWGSQDAPAARQALALLEAGLRLTPDAPLGLCGRAQAQLLLGAREQARAAASRAAELAPRDALPLLLLARLEACRAQEASLAADLLRAAGEGDPAGDDHRAAEGWQAAALAFRRARASTPAGGPLEDEARLASAGALLERARRLALLGRAEDAPALAAPALTDALREELGPLLRDHDPVALAALRGRLARALLEDDRPALDALDRELAALVPGAERARAALRLLAVSAGPGSREDAAHALLEADLPARAILAGRRAEASEDPARRSAELARALELDPDQPLARLVGAAHGEWTWTPTTLLELGRLLQRDPDSACALLDGLASLPDGAPPPPTDEALGLLGRDAAGLLGRALGLLLQAGSAPPARGPALALSAATVARQATAAGAPAGHLLRGLALLRVRDPALTPELEASLTAAAAAAPLASAPGLLRLEACGAAQRAQQVDRLLVRGFLDNAASLQRRGPGQAPDATLAELEQPLLFLTRQRGDRPPDTSQLAARLAGSPYRLLSRVLTSALATRGGLSFAAAREAATPDEALADHPLLLANLAARALLAIPRGEPEAEREARRRQAAAHALRGLVAAAPGAPLELSPPLQLLPQPSPTAWPEPWQEAHARWLPRPAALARDLLALSRGHQALESLASAWPGAASPPAEPLARLAPWAPGRAARAQLGLGGWQYDLCQRLFREGDLREAVLAFERTAAFWADAPGEQALVLAQYGPRYAALTGVAPDVPATLQAGLGLARRHAETCASAPHRRGLRAVEADLLFDLAALAGAPAERARLEAQAWEATRAAEGQLPASVSPGLIAWRRLRQAGLRGDRTAALGALRALEEAARTWNDWEVQHFARREALPPLVAELGQEDPFLRKYLAERER